MDKDFRDYKAENWLELFSNSYNEDGIDKVYLVWFEITTI